MDGSQKRQAGSTKDSLSGHRKGRVVADPGPYLSRGAPPSSGWYSPGLQATLGAMGL